MSLTHGARSRDRPHDLPSQLTWEGLRKLSQHPTDAGPGRVRLGLARH